MDKNELAKVAEAARNGDRQAFETLYNEYRDKLYFFVKKNVRSEDAAEDIVSETFVTAMEKMTSLKSGEAFGSWLYTIAYNKSMLYLKRNSRYAHFESEEEQESMMETAGLNDLVELPEDYAVNRQRQEELKKIIDDLKPDQRSAIILFYYEQMSLKQVADSLGITETNAKQKLFTARKKIKQGIEKLYKDGSAFAAVPMASMLDSVMNRKSISAAKAAALPAGGTVSVSGKVIAAAASLTVAAAAGVTFILSRGGLRGELNGDVRRNIAMIPDSSIAEVQSDTVTTKAPEVTTDTTAETTVSSRADAVSSSGSAADSSHAAAGGSSSAAAVSSSSAASASSSLSDTASTPDPIPTDILDIKGEQLMTTTAQFLELTGGNYTIEPLENGIDNWDFSGETLVAIKSERMPGLSYITGYMDHIRGEPQGPYEAADPAAPGYKYVFYEDAGPRAIEITGSAGLSSTASAGMSYTDLKAIYGDRFRMIRSVGYGVNYYCLAPISENRSEDISTGSVWYFAFDLTDEQKAIIDERAADQLAQGRAENPDLPDADIDRTVDVSDLDPTCRCIYAIFS